MILVDNGLDFGIISSRFTEYLDNHPGIHQEFKLVKFTDFSESSLDIFLYYFTVTTDWTEHLSLRQEVNLEIMTILENLGLAIAFPTRTVHLAGTGTAVQTGTG